METQSWSPPKEVVAFTRDGEEFADRHRGWDDNVRHVGQAEAFRNFMLRASRFEAQLLTLFSVLTFFL